MICECVVINVGEEEVRGHAGHTLLAATMAPSLPRSAPAPLLLLLLLRVLLLFSPAVRTHGTVMPRQFCCCTDRFIRTLGGGFFLCGESGTRTGWTWSEARRGAADGGPLWLSIVPGSGAPRTRRGETGGASRSFRVLALFFPLFAAIQVFFKDLMRGESERSQARRSFCPPPRFFGALIWQIGLPDSQTVSPPLPLLLSPVSSSLFSGTLSAISASLWTPV